MSFFLVNELAVFIYLCSDIIYIRFSVAVRPPKLGIFNFGAVSADFSFFYREAYFKTAVITATALKCKFDILKIAPFALKFIHNIAILQAWLKE